MTLEGAVDSIAFKVYVQQVLAPGLRLGQIVVLDNLQVHKNQAVQEMIEADRPGRLELRTLAVCRSVQDSSGL